jgi:hypothetical protein
MATLIGGVSVALNKAAGLVGETSGWAPTDGQSARAKALLIRLSRNVVVQAFNQWRNCLFNDETLRRLSDADIMKVKKAIHEMEDKKIKALKEERTKCRQAKYQFLMRYRDHAQKMSAKQATMNDLAIQELKEKLLELGGDIR